MELENLATKKKVIESAVILFKVKGYHGTSIREIARSAKVNISSVSYYFNGKQGLLEEIIISFLEGYMEVCESIFSEKSKNVENNSFQRLMNVILEYHYEYRDEANVFYKELATDSTFIREIMSTYLAREKYYFEMLYEIHKKQNISCSMPFTLFFVQLKSLITTPYLFPSYLSEVLYIRLDDPYFLQRYKEQVSNWIIIVTGEQEEQTFEYIG
jgi:AcrR family transcriptional regulator